MLFLVIHLVVVGAPRALEPAKGLSNLLCMHVGVTLVEVVEMVVVVKMVVDMERASSQLVVVKAVVLSATTVGSQGTMHVIAGQRMASHVDSTMWSTTHLPQMLTTAVRAQKTEHRCTNSLCHVE